MLNAIPSHLGPAISILNVSPIETDHRSLKSIIRHTNWALHRAPCLLSAATILRDVPVSVILCDCALQSGKWTDLLKEAATIPVPPPLIVTTRRTDNVPWGEVLNLGGYDLLRKPFAPSEVMHVVSLAWWHWHRKNGFPAEPRRQSHRVHCNTSPIWAPHDPPVFLRNNAADRPRAE